MEDLFQTSFDHESLTWLIRESDPVIFPGSFESLTDVSPKFSEGKEKKLFVDGMIPVSLSTLLKLPDLLIHVSLFLLLLQK